MSFDYLPRAVWFKTLINSIKYIKNWPECIYDRLGILIPKNNKREYHLRNGTTYELEVGAFGVLNEIVLRKIYFPEFFKIDQKDIVLDVGAHAGVFSILAAKKARFGKVYSFEPMPFNIEMLRKNISLNSLQNIEPLEIALTDKEGVADFYMDDHGLHTMYLQEGRCKKIKVKTTTLNRFMKQFKLSRIDFLKMDCEGAEYPILFSTSKKTLLKIKKYLWRSII